jgi:mannitol/fructose-specific phosphotransferase system IIA component (Ntr-type)
VSVLSQLLTKDTIQFASSAANWQAAIRLAADPLVASGAAKAAYVDAMVRSVLDAGPYIVVDEGFALPHARPEDGALRTGLSMLILREPVDLLDQRVRVFAALSAADSTSHLTALKELAELIWNGGTADVLASLGTPSAVAEYIRTHTDNK